MCVGHDLACVRRAVYSLRSESGDRTIRTLQRRRNLREHVELQSLFILGPDVCRSTRFVWSRIGHGKGCITRGIKLLQGRDSVRTVRHANPRISVFDEVLMRGAPHECPIPRSGIFERLQDHIAAKPCGNSRAANQNPRGIWRIGSFDLHAPVRGPLVNIGRAADDVFLFDISSRLKIDNSLDASRGEKSVVIRIGRERRRKFRRRDRLLSRNIARKAAQENHDCHQSNRYISNRRHRQSSHRNLLRTETVERTRPSTQTTAIPPESARCSLLHKSVSRPDSA
jgi:hypothetical protein